MTASAFHCHLHHSTGSDCYDSDDVLQHDNPQAQVYIPRLQPSPSSPPHLSPGAKSSLGRRERRPTEADAVVLAHLGDGRLLHVAHRASRENLAPDNGPKADSASPSSPDRNMAKPAESFDLKILAAGALAFTTTDALATKEISPRAIYKPDGLPSENISTSQHYSISGSRSRELPLRDERPTLAAPAVLYSAGDNHAPRRSFPSLGNADITSPVSPSQTASGGLPPLLDSPTSDGSVHGPLPSIRSQLENLKHLPDSAIGPENDLSSVPHVASFSRSPPANIPRLPSLVGFPLGQASPPISPSEGFRRELPSPAHTILSSLSPYGYSSSAGRPWPGTEYSSGTTETPITDQPILTLAHSVADRMSIDGLTNPQAGYICTFSGCNAAPFQTQYLLNSHANVHSSARPHYCSVKGCPRSEGGKGFKRKNEMIRHGLVHDSPGYVCPFCPDREHKYPRPDNLQRHVRVHHVDKDKDDPLLRDVLSQRPDGPNRGRRRRGGPS